jgi:hypothetical protein
MPHFALTSTGNIAATIATTLLILSDPCRLINSYNCCNHGTTTNRAASTPESPLRTFMRTGQQWPGVLEWVVAFLSVH